MLGRGGNLMSRLVKSFLRFRLRTVLVAVTLAARALWWERWPFATAHQFVGGTAKVAVEPHQPSGYWFPEAVPEGFRAMIDKSENEVVLTNHSRSFYDIALGRCTFIAQGKNGGYFRFWVKRGAVVGGPTPVYYYVGQEFMFDVF